MLPVYPRFADLTPPYNTRDRSRAAQPSTPLVEFSRSTPARSSAFHDENRHASLTVTALVFPTRKDTMFDVAKKTPRRLTPRLDRRLRLEWLEDRTTPSTF